MGLKYSNWQSMTDFSKVKYTQPGWTEMDTSGDGVCWNSEGTRWRHPSTRSPKITQRVKGSDPLLGQGTSVMGSSNACVVTVFPGSGEISIVTPLNSRTLETLVEEGELEGADVVSWRQRNPTIMLGSCYPLFQLQPATLGTHGQERDKVCPL